MSELNGVDVSTAQGAIDWDTLKDTGISFAIIRAAQGTYQDSRFTRNITECRRVGIPYGLYFAASAKNTAEAQTEAEFAEGYGRLYAPTYGMWYDMELAGQKQLGKSAISEMLRVWLVHIKAAGYRCGIYTNKDWLDNRIDHALLDEYDLWYAAYPSTAKKVLSDAPRNNRDLLSYPQAAIWQWSSTGNIDGVLGNVDLNICYDTFESASGDKGYISMDEAKKIITALGYAGIIL